MSWFFTRLGLAELLSNPTVPDAPDDGTPATPSAPEGTAAVLGTVHEPLALTAHRLLARFEENAVAAAATLIGQRVRVAGMVSRVDAAPEGAPVVLLALAERSRHVCCGLPAGTAGVTELATGDLVELTGVVRGVTYGDVVMRCESLRVLALG